MEEKDLSDARKTWSDSVNILQPEQKKDFREYLVNKVFRTERNVAILVALLQLCMLLLFLANKRISFENIRTVGYVSFYTFLFITTVIAIVLYNHLVKHRKYRAFLWLRRIYAFFLCFWVIGITFLEQMNGNGIAVYCYLLPTTAALLLLSPVESIVIFGTTWAGLAYMLVTISGVNGSIFGEMVNSIFVLVLSLFISYRYYRSMAMEFCDRQTIASQYEVIEEANSKLQQTVHIDQLTGLYNRHYLLEKIYPEFTKCRISNYYAMFLMIDIDYFKQYNDLYGHVQGDACLQQISGVIRQMCVKENAAAIRYGGEEFLVIKMSEQEFDGPGLAQAILSSIKLADIKRDDIKQKRVTVSAGIWYNRLWEAEHIELAIKMADDALYQAKSMGRDRIIESC